MKTGGMDAARKIRKKSPKTKHKKVVQQILPDDDNTSNEQAETSDVPQDTETGIYTSLIQCMVQGKIYSAGKKYRGNK